MAKLWNMPTCLLVVGWIKTMYKHTYTHIHTLHTHTPHSRVLIHHKEKQIQFAGKNKWVELEIIGCVKQARWVPYIFTHMWKLGEPRT